MTDKLYLTDAYLREFSAAVVQARETAEGWEIVLDRTAFYPEGGGQPCDTGEIDGIPVMSVREAGEQVIHILPIPPAGRTITGRINWAKRFYHMQQHSGQHILSAIFDNLYQAATIGFHLGAESTQIDLTLAELTHKQALEVEAAVNAAVYANIPVTAAIVERKDLQRFPLRKLPAKDFPQLRLISAGSLDCCPCGGTHVNSTGEIGIIKILGWEKKNNAVRVDFVCGERALSDYQQKHRLIKEFMTRLSSSLNELPEAFSQRMEKADALTKELADARIELNKYLAASLLQTAAVNQGVRLIAHILKDAQPGDAATLAKALTASEPAIALVAAVSPDGSKAHLVFATNINGPDMNKLLKQALAALNGRGGGNPRLAQGGANNPSGLPELLDSMLQSITANTLAETGER